MVLNSEQLVDEKLNYKRYTKYYMNILIVSAHDEPKSFVAALHNTALSILERAGHKVEITDLYAQGFNPVASKVDFKISSGTQANYMFEQQRTVNTGSGFSPDIQAEMDKVARADLLIFHFPLWWGSPPAILSGWFERIFAMGFAWSSEAKYQNGLMKGKKVLLTCTVGDPGSFYTSQGIHKATVEQHLYSLTHNTLALCGFDVYSPAIISNVTAADNDELTNDISSYRDLLNGIESLDSYLYKQG